jgi:hypothetical protein
VASIPSTSGSQIPEHPHVIARRRRRAKAGSHSLTNKKRSQSESTHSPLRVQTLDVHAHEYKLAEGTSSVKDNQVSDPPEQEPLESLHVERPDLDESATTPCPERRFSSTLSQQGSDDGQDYMHLSGLGFADKDSQQEDDDAVLGCEVQPDDVPDGLYD